LYREAPGRCYSAGVSIVPRALPVILVAASAMTAAGACGRVGFQAAPASDAPSNGCVDGDGICLSSCVGMDSDCTTTCGDGRCVGNNGETCESCPADCATLTAVCGNGACEAGEQDTCFNDCGPDPWTWLADEQAFLTEVNNARVNGTTCPGMGATTAPALTLTAALTPPAHEWAWEIGHGNYYMSNAQACNGRTFAQRSAEGGYITALSAFGFASGTAAAQFFETDTASCPTLMDSARHEVGVGVTLDGQRGFVLVFK
jgi:hypothetical protein